MTPPTAPPHDVLVIVAHPQLEQSRANRLMMRSARSVPGVQVRDLYARYPDYLIDVEAEQAALAAARLIVWQHPIHWYSMPPLMKLWLDEVLVYGWAYGPAAGALAGKHVWLAATTGGPEESYRPDSYNRYFFDAFLPPYEQTAALCGMRFLPPLLLHGAHGIGDAALQAHAALYAQRLAAHPDWPELEAPEPCPTCVVPPTARPQDEADAAPADATAARAGVSA